MKKISVVSSCFNEADNVDVLCLRVRAVFDALGPFYTYEHILLDNGSTDQTALKLRALASSDKRIKVILNARNFGHIRSPFYGILQASGDAVIYMASDLQDPPELILDFIREWESGFKMVLGIKKESKESFVFFLIRRFFYLLIRKISDDNTSLIKNYTGFGLYDRTIVDIMRLSTDPYPYFRGFVCEIGFEKAYVEFVQPLRTRGVTANNFYTLYDNAMIGITKHSRVPLRIAVFLGFFLSILSGGISVFYFIAKLLFWDKFEFGLAPILIGIFFFFSIQLLFMGILGEYIGAILIRVNIKPLVFEKERINFD